MYNLKSHTFSEDRPIKRIEIGRGTALSRLAFFDEDGELLLQIKGSYAVYQTDVVHLERGQSIVGVAVAAGKRYIRSI